MDLSHVQSCAESKIKGLNTEKIKHTVVAEIIRALGICSMIVEVAFLQNYIKSHYYVIMQYLQNHHKEIWLIFPIKSKSKNEGLVPSSPDLNPIQQIWASCKTNWTHLLYINMKDFGLSCKKHEITLVLKFSIKILILCQRCAAVTAAKVEKLHMRVKVDKKQ